MTEEEFEELKTNGIKVQYWAVCPRKLWLYAKGVRLEATSDRVSLGRLLHEHSYSYLPRHELLVDNLIKVDVLEGENKILEVKSSRKLIEAARLQVAYYLVYLKRIGAGELIGELRFPKQRRREEVRLTEDLEAKVTEALRNIRQVEGSPDPPPAEFTNICRACAYIELCWG